MLIVGLGNPGKEYAMTRHNAGFMAVDAIAKTHNFPEFVLSKKHNALVSEGVIGGKKVLLAKPQTFMNSSGKAVASLAQFFKLATTDIVVIHDDIDFLFGKVKEAANSGAAGHHGVESIIESLGTKEFRRLRVGIRPAEGRPDIVDEFVLRPFTPQEQTLLPSIFADCDRRS